MYRFYIVPGFIFILSVFIPTLCDVNNTTFVPTSEWQTIKEGQSIPPGLHIRINLKTGEKEAKLIEKTRSGSDLATLPESQRQDEPSQEPEQLQTARQNLEKALKDIPTDTFEYSEEHVQELRKKYKSYKELKKEFANVNMNIKTDSEIITDLIAEYKNTTTDDGRFLGILDDLDYLVHQIDNALWFIDKGGLDSIVIPAITNSTNANIRIKSLRLLGALIHNNPKAQVGALEKNCATYLSQTLIASSNSEETSAAIYAFGSLLRNFPFAQRDILSKTGLRALLSIFGKKSIELRVRVKSLTLLSDLMAEQQQIFSKHASDSNSEKVEQYKTVMLDIWLHDVKFCETIDEFVAMNFEEIAKDTSVIEYLLEGLNRSLNFCYDVWSQSSGFRQAMQYLKDLFANAKPENQDDPWDVAENAALVYDRLYGKLKFTDEL